jgi:hypothetical protein
MSSTSPSASPSPSAPAPAIASPSESPSSSPSLAPTSPSPSDSLPSVSISPSNSPAPISESVSPSLSPSASPSAPPPSPSPKLTSSQSMLNKWDYSVVSDVCYADVDQQSYKKAAAFLGDSVEDWGCGTAWARRFFKNYRGIDGSAHRNTDEVVDLVDYTSNVDNILMREALEYNLAWKKILNNIKASFNKKFCLIISTPFADKTHVETYYEARTKNGGTIPEIRFNKTDILNEFPQPEFKISEETIKTNHLYNQDWILYVER